MSTLRDPLSGCPWDLGQDFSSIAPYTVEEAYEVSDAIARGDMPGLRDELGDLLFQVVFHAQLAAETGDFDFDGVASAICDKMIRRHPHVFGDDEQRARGAMPGSWERIKSSERAVTAAAAGSVLDGIAKSLPALKRAEKIGRRAAAAGFDWPDAGGARQKIDEELTELDQAMRGAATEQITEELGDLLFSVVNLARHLHIDAEQALVSANRKFERRFRQMEADLADGGATLRDLDMDSLEARWQAAKASVAG